MTTIGEQWEFNRLMGQVVSFLEVISIAITFVMAPGVVIEVLEAQQQRIILLIALPES